MQRVWNNFCWYSKHIIRWVTVFDFCYNTFLQYIFANIKFIKGRSKLTQLGIFVILIISTTIIINIIFFTALIDINGIFSLTIYSRSKRIVIIKNISINFKVRLQHNIHYFNKNCS